MRLFDTSFRTKLLVALVGTVSLLGFATLVVVRYQRERQVEWLVARTAERSQQALAELERFRRADLERIARRFTGSIRIAAALDAVLEGGDAGEFVEHVLYELTLAELEQGLVVFSDTAGRPVATLVDGVRTADAEGRGDFVALVLAGETAPVGYRVHQGRLYAIQGHRLELFGQPVGALTLGFAVDDEVASRLSEIVDAEVCFAAGGRCIAGTAAASDTGLARLMLDAAGADRPIFTTWEGRRLALVSSPLSAVDGILGLIAVPLEAVLTPFDRIQQAERIAAATALTLAIVLGILLSRRLTTPVRALVAATDRVRRGDYDFTLRITHRDELGTLAEAFNHMTQGLLLKERYRGVLDKVVSRHVADELLRGEIRLGGETREVTTLFGDIRGFTGLTERMQPEDVIAMLNEWLERAGEAIEQEGGVVDKYVGDQIMAIFGAPLAQEDHAARAVRAALRLRAATEELNRRREARGLLPLSVGIGINTGPAVAGNTGSSRRLNYTVLGRAVNAAARLCSEAGPGQVLISGETYARVADNVDATPLVPRIVKGFSEPLTPYLVHGARSEPRQAPRVPGGAVLLGLLLLSTAAPAAGQTLDFPTLSELGIQYVSPEGFLQIRPSLRVDLEGYVPQQEPAWQIDEVDPFVAGRARLFVDVFAGRRIFASAELRADRGQPPRAGSLDGRVQQAFVRVTPVPGADFSLQAGKMISPFGSYPQRAHTPADSFIRPPLAYDHRTVMQADFVPAGSDGVLGWKDNPALRRSGLPIVWAVPYPVAVTATGRARGLAFRLGVANSAPSAEPSDWNRLRLEPPAGPTFVGHVSYQLLPEIQVGASYSRGSYLRPGVSDAAGPVETGRTDQEAFGLEAAFQRGHVEVLSEVVVNRWQVFRVIDDPRDVSYHVEGRVTFAPGLYGALRYSAIHFREIRRQAGGQGRWDYDVRRLQLGAGYRLGRGTGIRGEYMVNERAGNTTDPRDNLLSLQWWWAF